MSTQPPSNPPQQDREDGPRLPPDFARKAAEELRGVAERATSDYTRAGTLRIADSLTQPEADPEVPRCGAKVIRERFEEQIASRRAAAAAAKGCGDIEEAVRLERSANAIAHAVEMVFDLEPGTDKFPRSNLTQPVPGNSGGVEEGLLEAVRRDLHSESEETTVLAGPLGEAIASASGSYSLEFTTPEQVAEGFCAWLKSARKFSPDATLTGRELAEAAASPQAEVQDCERCEGKGSMSLPSLGAPKSHPCPYCKGTGKQSPAEPQGDVVGALAKRVHEREHAAGFDDRPWDALPEPTQRNQRQQAREDIDFLTPLLALEVKERLGVDLRERAHREREKKTVQGAARAVALEEARAALHTPAPSETCPKDSDWCDGKLCRERGIDCPNADPAPSEPEEGR